MRTSSASYSVLVRHMMIVRSSPAVTSATAVLFLTVSLSPGALHVVDHPEGLRLCFFPDEPGGKVGTARFDADVVPPEGAADGEIS